MIASLLLAAALGQNCPGGVCPAPGRATAPQATRSPWQKVAVRIEAPEGRLTGWGSGVIVASDGERSLVLTNRHVVGRSKDVRVHYLGGIYHANIVRISPDADIAGLEIASPGNIGNLPIAERQPDNAWAFGFGQSGQFHSHNGQYIGAYTSGDQRYRFVPHDGDSGSAIISQDGELAGLVWGGDESTSAAVVSLPKLRQFLIHPTCLRFFRRRQPATQVIQVNVPTPAPAPIEPTPAPAPVDVPSSPATQPQPVAVVGPQGPPGPMGPPGATPDLSGILARITALENQTTVVALKQPDGTSSPAKTYYPQVDPKTGKRAIGILLDLNPPAKP